MAFEYFKEKLYPEDQRMDYRLRQSKKAVEQAKKDKELYDKVEPVVGNLIAPRTYNDGLSLKNIGLDLIDWTPAAPLAYGADVALGDEEFSPVMAAVMGIPFVPGKSAQEGTKYLRRLFNKGYGKGELKKELIEELGPEAGATVYNALAQRRRNLNNGASKMLTNEPRVQNERRISSRGQINSDITEASQLAPNTVVGPTGHSNTGSTVRSQGQMMMNTNTRPYRNRSRTEVNGAQGYQGPMYDPRRELKQSEYGPFQTVDGMLPWSNDPYTIHLNNNLNELRNKYEYLINKTRASAPGAKRKTPPLSKDEAIAIAIAQGRPDIADIIKADNKVRVPEKHDPRFNSYASNSSGVGLETYLDNSNRSVEKELREVFATIPDNQKEVFAKHYGVWDLLDDWKSDPDKWSDYAKEVKTSRYNRERTNAWFDRKYRQ